MEEEEFTRSGIESERDDATERAVSPADFLLILLVGVLRIDDQDISAMKELDQLGALARGIGLSFLEVGFAAG